MSTGFEQQLQKYADLTIQVGLNLQPGQRLMIAEPLTNNGVQLHAAPLIRLIAASAYRAGARFVDVIWNDDQLHLIRFGCAPRDSFEEYPSWQTAAMRESIERGDAYLVIFANNPDLLSSQDQELVSLTQKSTWQQIHPILEHLQRNATNWSVIATSLPAWAAKVFPSVPADEQEHRLWEAIFAACRIDRQDPVAAWRKHVDELTRRCMYLNNRRYAALHFTGPGTDLTVGLPEGHLWKSVGLPTQSGIKFVPNVPSEEVWTLPHRRRTDGVVRATRPLHYAGTLIEDFSLSFANGRVVESRAAKGEIVLRKLLETDESAGRLGEVALVPHSSPIAQSGLLFYNTLFDENAASHIALGSAYRFNLSGGEKMSKEEFIAAGGNQGLVHVDFMIGSGEMAVDGLSSDGAAEPLMRRGEWALQ